MRLILLAVALTSAAAFAVPATAAPPKSIKVPLCPGTQNGPAMAQCLEPKLEAATQSLTATVIAIKTKGKFDAATAMAYDSAHDVWVKDMSSTCHAAEVVYNQGDIQYSVGIRCKLEMTQAREQLLKSLYATILFN